MKRLLALLTTSVAALCLVGVADAQSNVSSPTVTYSSGPFAAFPASGPGASPNITQEYCTYNQSEYKRFGDINSDYLHVKGFESGCTRANLSVTIDLLQNGNFWKQVSQLSCSNSTQCVAPSTDYFNCFLQGVDYDVQVIGSHLYNTKTIDYHFRSCLG